ncbi:MAG: sirohydrochlorin cobaltochelatase [Desulfofustis sp.]|nr:sirohydrochlorin cobaltochelatase [Desulfofustis sp.]
MKRRSAVTWLIVAWVLLVASGPAAAAGHGQEKQEDAAIVLAYFGTTVPGAIGAITNIADTVRAAYPETEVRITFTSNIIRSIWKKRLAERQVWLDKGIPEEVLAVKNVIATIGDLQEDGYRRIIVQPTHMFFMEQSHDLLQHVNALASIRTMKERWRPFDQLVMGRPALGMPGDRYSYHDDIDAVVATLAADIQQARQAGAALVYMGHGNEHWSTGIYGEVQQKLREVYPDVASYVGVVEGYPSLSDLLPEIKAGRAKKVILKPFMIVAGDHAVNDMAGPEADSWQSILTAEGFTVEPVLTGLGENHAFARLFVDHIADAAKERGIELK